MKVYTRKGDDGKTHLFGGRRVAKNAPRIEAYGAVDETNSWLGLLRDVIEDDGLRELLLRIQQEAFVVGAHLATVKPELREKLPAPDEDIVGAMEAAIDRMDADLPPLKTFILPGGHPHASYAHIARTVCRRAERAAVPLLEDDPWVGRYALPFLNRLSDLLFVLARYLVHRRGQKEIPWQPERSQPSA